MVAVPPPPQLMLGVPGGFGGFAPKGIGFPLPEESNILATNIEPYTTPFPGLPFRVKVPVTRRMPVPVVPPLYV